MMLIAALACEAEPTWVTVSGTVYDDHHDEALPLAGATVELLDGALTTSDTQTTAEDGTFAAQAVGGGYLFIQLAAEGYQPTAFSGSVGTADSSVEDGVLWLESDEDRSELAGLFSGCAGADDPTGAVIEGEVRFWIEDTTVVEGGDWPLAVTAYVLASSDGGETLVGACYLDDEGVGYDAEAQVTGQTGRFALFGAPTGVVTVEVGYLQAEEELPEGTEPEVLDWVQYVMYVPEGGMAPMYPAYLPFPQ